MIVAAVVVGLGLGLGGWISRSAIMIVLVEDQSKRPTTLREKVGIFFACYTRVPWKMSVGLNKALNGDDKAASNEFQIQEVLKLFQRIIRFGPMTGFFERILVLIFSYFRNFEAVGAALLAKGIIVQIMLPHQGQELQTTAGSGSTDDISELPLRREVYLLGTLVSFVMAICSGVFLDWATSPRPESDQPQRVTPAASPPASLSLSVANPGLATPPTPVDNQNGSNHDQEGFIVPTVSPQPVLMDVDTGVDDALALLLAWHAPSLRVVGVTTVSGNIDSAQAYANTQFLYDSYQLPGEFPILCGSHHGLNGRVPNPVPWIHGVDGLGGARAAARLASPQRPSQSNDESSPGVSFLVKAARQYGPELTVVATGPLTNLAHAIFRDPESMRGIKEVLVMGGAIRVPGNISPEAEFNFASDPESADIVMNFGIPIRLFPLDVTQEVRLLRSSIDDHPNVSLGTRELIKAVCGVYMSFHAKKYGFDGSFTHDVLPIVGILEPDAFEYEQGFVRVGTAETEAPGKADFYAAPDKGNVRVATWANKQRVQAIFWNTLANPIPRCSYQAPASSDTADNKARRKPASTLKP